MRDDTKRLEPGLYRLTELPDYEVADRDPDVRGWNVLSADKKFIGKVDELIVDLDALKVRYLDVNINKEINEAGTDNRHLLIPIGAAELDGRDDIVRVNNIETITLLKLPEYNGGTISREYERNLRSSFASDYNSAETGENFYNHPLYNDERFYGSRRKFLIKLDDIDKFRVLGTHPDVRGWDTFTSDKVKIGVVSEIIIDRRYNKIRYLDIVTLEGKHFLVPIGLVFASQDTKNIHIDLSKDEIKTYPAYRGDEINRNYEILLYESLRKNVPIKKGTEFYSDQHYDDSRFFHP